MLSKNEIKKEKEIEMRSTQVVSFKDIEAKRPSWIKADKITEKEIMSLIDDWLTKNEYKNALSFCKFINDLKVTSPLQTPPVTPRNESTAEEDQHPELSDIF